MRRIRQCRHAHTGDVLAVDVREGDAVCIDGVAGVAVTDPVYVGADLMVYLDGVDDIRVHPQDVLARIGQDTVAALYAEEDAYEEEYYDD